jgi:molybdopterin-guanine dinucleotide biosynthesis protein A
MGRDKALLPFGGRESLIAYQYYRLAPLFRETYLSLKADKCDLKAPILYDSSTISAPLVALVSILRAVKTPRVFVIAVDTPFFDASAIGELLSVQAPVVMARTPGGTHPLVAVYDRRVLVALEVALSRNELALHRTLEKLRVETVDFEEALLTNLNHPHEYEKASGQCVSA